MKEQLIHSVRRFYTRAFATGNVQNREEMLEDASALSFPWGRTGDLPKVPYPQTARKLALMLRRFEEDGFTSKRSPA